MVEKVENYSIVKVTNETGKELKDTITIEEPLTIFLNGEELVTLLYSPSYPKQLAVGFLVSEGVIKKKSDIESLRFYTSKGVVNISVKGNGDLSKPLSSKRIITSGCCGGTSFYRSDDRNRFRKNRSRKTHKRDSIIRLMKEMSRRSIEFRKTGGVHASSLAKDGKIVFFREDIGRHNAIDKIIGECILSDISLSDSVLLTSGRITSEITRKAGSVGIPVIASRSAPTSLSIEMARELKLTLVGFVRGKRMNIYTEKWRIT